ncbi:MAG: succinylglutamate desuccinylase/aspartoacylase family protein [Planctomycetota bacterium]
MTILDQAPRGTITRTFLETGAWQAGLRVRLPVVILRGPADGPVLAVQAAQHGREVAGIAACYAAAESVDPARLRGTLVLLPVMNPLAVRMRQQDFPYETGRYGNAVSANLNRHWNGTGNYPLLGEMASVVRAEVHDHADALLDIHGWSAGTIGLAWTSREHLELLVASGYPFLADVGPAADQRNANFAGSAFRKTGRPGITVELPTQNTFESHHIQLGRRTILNLARKLGMLEESLELPYRQLLFDPSCENRALAGEHEGMAVFDMARGELVEPGTRLGRIVSLETLETLQELTAPVAGAIMYELRPPSEAVPMSSIVMPGDAVAEIRPVAREIVNAP